MAYIDKSAVVAEIDSILNETNYKPFTDEVLGERKVCKDIKDFLDTLEVKEEILDKSVREAFKSGYEMGTLQATSKMKHNIKEVDLEKEIASQYESNYEEYLTYDEFADIARHFFELGLKAQKGE